MADNNSSFLTQSTDWSISSDIYDIVESVEKLKKRYIEDEDETTLALGIFGFLGDTEAKKIQTSIIMAGELGNEMFAQRAKLDKNVTTHAIYANIEDINAVPSHMIINIAVRLSDLDMYMQDNIFIFDHNTNIDIGNNVFHLDYDIKITRIIRGDKKLYMAVYDMDEKNYTSDIVNPYLKQPFTYNYNNESYLFLQSLVRQVSIKDITDVMVSTSIIDTKSYFFNFENQLTWFDVYITENDKTTRLKPYIYGSVIDPEDEYYCWYLFINDNTIRINFEQESYQPGLNADIRIVTYTTLGEAGNIEYNAEADNNQGFYASFAFNGSANTVRCLVIPVTSATDGKNKKSIEELKNLIPKMAFSRGYITTETDLNNYFNLISNENNLLKLQKKVDNQVNRTWYCYTLLKDENDNVIPTSTIDIRFRLSELDNINYNNRYFRNYNYLTNVGNESKRFVIHAGQLWKYDESLGYAVPINTTTDPTSLPAIYSDAYFAGDGVYYYRSPYNIVLNLDPFYAGFYLSALDKTGYFEYEYVNDNAYLGFITSNYHIERKLLSERNQYIIKFTISQSVASDFGIYKYALDEDGKETEEYGSTLLAVYLVLYKDGEPYRYIQCALTGYNASDYSYDYECRLFTEENFDKDNELEILRDPNTSHFTLYQQYECGSDLGSNIGYYSENIEAKVFIYVKLPELYGRGDGNSYDNIISPATIVYNQITSYTKKTSTGSTVVLWTGADRSDPMFDNGYQISNYTLLNVYTFSDGINLFDNYTSVINARTIQKLAGYDQYGMPYYSYILEGVPVIGEHYFKNYNNNGGDENTVKYFINELRKKRSYINYCLSVIENSMNIDFKFYKTYGHSNSYTIGDDEDTSLGDIDIIMSFRLKLSNSNDISVKNDIIAYIKDYVENLNNTNEDLHMPNLVSSVMDEYKDKIIYFEFMNFNKNRLGINHIELKDVIDPHQVPEFINVRNRLKDDGKTLEPCIDIEIVT